MTSYGVRANAYVAMHAGGWWILYAPGERGHCPERWAAWSAYFASLGERAPDHSFALRRFRLIIVPAEWPTQFDADAPVHRRDLALWFWL